MPAGRARLVHQEMRSSLHFNFCWHFNVWVQGKGGIYLAGAWCGYGFHEDGLKAGIEAAQALGATIPWVSRATSPKISLLDHFFMGVFDKFARAAIFVGHLRIILPNGKELEYGNADATEPSVAPGRLWHFDACDQRTAC